MGVPVHFSLDSGTIPLMGHSFASAVLGLVGQPKLQKYVQKEVGTRHDVFLELGEPYNDESLELETRARFSWPFYLCRLSSV